MRATALWLISCSFGCAVPGSSDDVGVRGRSNGKGESAAVAVVEKTIVVGLEKTPGNLTVLTAESADLQAVGPFADVAIDLSTSDIGGADRYLTVRHEDASPVIEDCGVMAACATPAHVLGGAFVFGVLYLGGAFEAGEPDEGAMNVHEIHYTALPTGALEELAEDWLDRAKQKLAVLSAPPLLLSLPWYQGLMRANRSEVGDNGSSPTIIMTAPGGPLALMEEADETLLAIGNEQFVLEEGVNASRVEGHWIPWLKSASEVTIEGVDGPALSMTADNKIAAAFRRHTADVGSPQIEPEDEDPDSVASLERQVDEAIGSRAINVTPNRLVDPLRGRNRLEALSNDEIESLRLALRRADGTVHPDTPFLRIRSHIISQAKTAGADSAEVTAIGRHRFVLSQSVYRGPPREGAMHDTTHFYQTTYASLRVRFQAGSAEWQRDYGVFVQKSGKAVSGVRVVPMRSVVRFEHTNNSEVLTRWAPAVPARLQSFVRYLRRPQQAAARGEILELERAIAQFHGRIGRVAHQREVVAQIVGRSL